MSEPLSRAHRDHIMSGIAWDIQSGLPLSPAHIDLPRYEATVQAAEERAAEAEARLRGLRRDWQRETRAREALRATLERIERSLSTPAHIVHIAEDAIAADDAARGER